MNCSHDPVTTEAQTTQQSRGLKGQAETLTARLRLKKLSMGLEEDGFHFWVLVRT